MLIVVPFAVMDRVVSDSTADNTEEEPTAGPSELFARLDSSPDGLSGSEVGKRLEQYGHDVLEEHRVSSPIKFLGYFWGPIPWMIEAAAVVSATVGHWADLTIILVLLIFNAGVGFCLDFAARHRHRFLSFARSSMFEYERGNGH